MPGPLGRCQVVLQVAFLMIPTPREGEEAGWYPTRHLGRLSLREAGRLIKRTQPVTYTHPHAASPTGVFLLRGLVLTLR